MLGKIPESSTLENPCRTKAESTRWQKEGKFYFSLAPGGASLAASPPEALPPTSFHDIEGEAAFPTVSCISKQHLNWPLNALLMMLSLINKTQSPSWANLEGLRRRADLTPAGGRQMEHSQLCELDPHARKHTAERASVPSVLWREEMLYAFYKTMNDEEPYLVIEIAAGQRELEP